MCLGLVQCGTVLVGTYLPWVVTDWTSTSVGAERASGSGCRKWMSCVLCYTSLTPSLLAEPHVGNRKPAPHQAASTGTYTGTYTYTPSIDKYAVKAEFICKLVLVREAIGCREFIKKLLEDVSIGMLQWHNG